MVYTGTEQVKIVSLCIARVAQLNALFASQTK
ncbi:MAG: hypothetical protein JWP71_1742 [Mucilaginibacter sp.]|nr:hypothetical protein [Mucilaginibacter sp.]